MKSSMVLRQILNGIGGGVILALVALFLTVPRAAIEKEAPLWVLSLVKTVFIQPDTDALQAKAEPTASSLVFSGEDAERVELVAQPEGQRVASLEPMLPGGSASMRAPENRFEDTLPAPALRADVLDPDSYLGALSKQTTIRDKPNAQGRIVGFARTGALLRRAQLASGHKDCKGGWYRVEPSGYICVGKAATLDLEHPILRLASVGPDRSLALPYLYGSSRYPTPPLYTKIPTKKEQQIAEQDLTGHLRKNFGVFWEESADTPPPLQLKDGERIPRPYGYPRLEREFMTGRALGSSAFAFIDLFESGGRKWGLTADLSLLPLDRLEPVKASDFSGVTLKENDELPVAFVRSRRMFLLERSVPGGSLRPKRAIDYREAFRLTGKIEKHHGARYWETREGEFLKEQEQVIVIEAREKFPKWAKENRSWIDVSILNQTLVAYRGTQPVFATLVSTGKDGLGDPEETHSTIQGIFLIHTKHVTSTMSGDAADDEFDLRDVPYVQYFHGGYAFHAAFWHDGFGQPRSHGCVNLSPSDARTLFSITDPPVPLRWHSALDMKGTLVYVHP